MRRLYANLTREEADTFALVLTAEGLTRFRLEQELDGWCILVAESIHTPAQRHIESYCRENPGTKIPADPEGRDRESSAHTTIQAKRTYSAIWIALFLLAAYLAAGSGPAFDKIAVLCGASSRDILEGELYRTATALMLHASPGHMAGNAAGLVLFGTAVCSITGPGLGWLLILLSGIVGNLANAVLIQSGHLSLGASTAVFGAVGLLSAYQFQRRLKKGLTRLKAWIPLAGGLALLGFLGTGPHTDLTAHLFGFVAGIVIGLISARYLKPQFQAKYQVFWSLVGASLLGGSWFWAHLLQTGRL